MLANENLPTHAAALLEALNTQMLFGRREDLLETVRYIDAVSKVGKGKSRSEDRP